MKFRYRNEDEMKYSGFEWSGDIPLKWTVEKLKYIINMEKGTNPKNINIEGVGMPYIGASSFYNKRYDNYTNDYGLTECGENDLLILWDGARAGIIDYGHKGAVSSTMVKITNTDEFINRNYFNWYLKSYQSYFIDMSNGTTIPHMNRRYIDELIFPKIDWETQTIVSKFLDKKTTQFDTIISKKEDLIKRLEEAKKSLISEVVTGKVKVVKTEDGYELEERKKEEMKYSGVEWLGDIPKEWDVKRLRFLGDLQNGISKGGDEFGFGYPFVSYGDVYKNMSLINTIKGLVNSTLSDRNVYSVLEGDVFFTRTSETVEEIGFSATCLETIANATFAGFLIRFRPIKGKLYKGFSKYYFRCDLNRRFFVKEMNLVTRASLSQNLLNNLAVPLPLYEDQIDIYEALEYKVSGIDSSIKKVISQIRNIKEAKQSLISEAVTGKIEILD